MTIPTMQPIPATQQAGQTCAENLSHEGTPDHVADAVEAFTETAMGAASLSVTSGLLAVQIDGLADVRWDRIRSLRERIAAGTYRVSSQQVAEKMLGCMLAR